MADDEEEADQAAHLLRVRQARVDYLRVVDEQVAQLGSYAPPHLRIEQAKLRQELGIVETVIAAPASTVIGDELGVGGRFLLTVEQNRQLDKKVADLVAAFTAFVEGSMAWRKFIQRWLVWIGVAVFVLALIAVGVLTYLATRGS